MDKIDIFKFKKIENFLSKDEIKLYSTYAKERHRNNFNDFDLQQTKTADTMCYKDFLFQFLLEDKKNIVESHTGLELLPTYSFWRCYTYGAELEKHKDRPSCEVSVTVNIDCDGTEWPIFIENKPMYLKPGDGVIYKGCEVEHWREVFNGDYQIQTFLHYVNKNGPYRDFANDERRT